MARNSLAHLLSALAAPHMQMPSIRGSISHTCNWLHHCASQASGWFQISISWHDLQMISWCLDSSCLQCQCHNPQPSPLHHPHELQRLVCGRCPDLRRSKHLQISNLKPLETTWVFTWTSWNQRANWLVKIYPMLIFKTGIGFPRHHQKGGFMKNHGIQLKSAFYEIISFTLDGRSAHSLAVFLASCQCTIKASGQGLSRLRLFRVVSGYTDLSPKNETNTIKNDGKAGPPPGFSRLRNCCVTLLFCQFMPGCLVCNTMELPLWIHQSRQWFPSVLVSCAASDCSPAKEKLGHCSSVCWNWKKQIS